MLLRFSVIACAIAVLLLSVRAAYAQDFTVAPGSSMPSSTTPSASAQGSVYGYNPGQGASHVDPQPAAPISPQVQVPYGPAPQAAYGYAAPPVMQQTQPQQRFGYATDRGAVAANYGAQAPAEPMAYYQDPIMGARVNAGYQLGAGDKIRVTVFGESDLSGEYQVDGSGVVRLPLIGTIRAQGYTAPGLEAWIGSALAQGYLKNPRVNVEIVTYRPFYIVGAVNRPGEYPYVDNMSAMNAVALAGGFTDAARQSTVYVRREGSTVEEEVPTEEITHIRPGDVVRVKTTLFWDAMQVLSPLAGPVALGAAVIR